MLFTSESVSEGHLDKLADRISDTILDLFLDSDPLAKVACETFIADDLIVVAGEFHTELFHTIRIEIPDIISNKILLHITHQPQGKFGGENAGVLRLVFF